MASEWMSREHQRVYTLRLQRHGSDEVDIQLDMDALRTSLHALCAKHLGTSGGHGSMYVTTFDPKGRPVGDQIGVHGLTGPEERSKWYVTYTDNFFSSDHEQKAEKVALTPAQRSQVERNISDLPDVVAAARKHTATPETRTGSVKQ